MKVVSRIGRGHAKRVVAALVTVLFCFQIARFYLVVSLDLVECYEPNHTHLAGSSHSHHDHHHDGDGAAPHSHDDPGFFFQHCKDTYDGAGLTPVQPFGVPVEVSQQQPATAWEKTVPVEPTLFENVLPPPFQPPRSLS